MLLKQLQPMNLLGHEVGQPQSLASQKLPDAVQEQESPVHAPSQLQGVNCDQISLAP
jgi:hypothetical protein